MQGFVAAINRQEHVPDPYIMVIFGASGDLTKRLLMPSLFNLYCARLLPESFTILGVSMDDFTTESFRTKMSDDIRLYADKKTFDPEKWQQFCSRIEYMTGRFDDVNTFKRLVGYLKTLGKQSGIGDNILFYMATPPAVFGIISNGIEQVGLNQEAEGWRRIIVEKPFGRDMASAQQLNAEMLQYWHEEQIYRIDHYLGKETVQNILAFRFANGMFEPLWRHTHIDHIQITASEEVGVEWRGGYYDQSGVIRDMIQNHLFQVMAYLCMEPPTSFEADAIRNEKYKLLSAVHVLKPEEVDAHAVRGQYGAGFRPDGDVAIAYRDEHAVDADSNTETFAALKLHINNWRWQGVPIFLCSGKGLRHKTTEIVVQFRCAPECTFEGSPAAAQLEGNQLIFRIQPDEGIELRFLAKRPGPTMQMRKVTMNFEYGESFVMQPGTGYETMLYDCMHGDASLFSRSDWVEKAWRIVQPVMDVWAAKKADDFPNYPFGSWGPKAAFDLLRDDHRCWQAPSPRQAIERVPLFSSCDDMALHSFSMMLKPVVFNAGDEITSCGSEGREFFIIETGQVEVMKIEGDGMEKSIVILGTGQTFSELSLLMTRKRRATVRAFSYCALYTMEKNDFCKVLMDRPEFADHLIQIASERYHIQVSGHEWLT